MRIIMQIQMICCILLRDVLQVVRLLLRYFQVVVFLMQFLLENLRVVVQHVNPNDAVRFESSNVKIYRWLFRNFLGHCQDLVHKIVAFILNIANY
jgi:hypothetical protein